MKRLHIHVAVENLPQSIGFYSALFAAGPAVVKTDYAKWMLDDPRVNFAISTRGREAGLDHLGIQVENADELQEVYARLRQAGGEVIEQGQTACCYAKSEKAWIDDPAGISWETFLTSGESTDLWRRHRRARGARGARKAERLLRAASRTQLPQADASLRPAAPPRGRNARHGAAGGDRGRFRHHGGDADQGRCAGAARQYDPDRRDPGGADHDPRADLGRAFQSGRHHGLCDQAGAEFRARLCPTWRRRSPAASPGP